MKRDPQVQTMIDNLPEKTGKSLSEWIAVLSMTSLEKHGQLVKHLKTEHGVTHGFANLVVHEYRNADTQEVDLVAVQYEKKAHLKPIYEQLVGQISEFGDVEISPKKKYVSLRAAKQFAILQPSTQKRFDVGLNFADKHATDRLEISGSFNGMVSHRVRITDIEQIDDELLGWLREAFEEAR